MKEFLIENKKIYFKDHLNGGGDDFGIKSMKNDLVFPNINKGKILEMCSGPGFIGFYLNFIGLAEELYLIDINDENRSCIEETIKYNKLTNTKFTHSNVFQSFNENVIFDTIVSNPPMFETPSARFHYENNEYLLAIDEDWKFHKEFFRNVERFMNENSTIIFIENHYGISIKQIKNLLNGTNLKIEHIISTNKTDYSTPTINHSFFTIVLKLKNDNDNTEIQKFI
jgi:methylase of polypeptide subunit release factors